VSVEPRTPQWNLGMVNGNAPKGAPMAVRMFAFMDYGQGYLSDPGPRDATTSLWGVGFGFIGNIGQHVDFRCSFGFPLLDVPGAKAEGLRVAFALAGQF
jgi:hemolysin activation/secretion protein